MNTPGKCSLKISTCSVNVYYMFCEKMRRFMVFLWNMWLFMTLFCELLWHVLWLFCDVLWHVLWFFVTCSVICLTCSVMFYGIFYVCFTFSVMWWTFLWFCFEQMILLLKNGNFENGEIWKCWKCGNAENGEISKFRCCLNFRNFRKCFCLLLTCFWRSHFFCIKVVKISLPPPV